VAGALLGGWAATKLFHVVTLHGFFNLSTWLTAIAGAAVLLLAYHLVTSRGNTGRTRTRARRRLIGSGNHSRRSCSGQRIASSADSWNSGST
jgi:Transglycosylase associated protein